MKKVFMAAWLALAALFVAIPVQAVPARWMPASTINIIDQGAAAASVTGTGAETTLVTINIPANTLAGNGRIRVTALWSFTNNANNKTPKIKIGGQTLFAQTHSGQSTLTQMRDVFQRNATTLISSPSGLQSIGLDGGVPNVVTVNMAVDQQIQFTCQLATAADTCTLEAYTVEIINP